MINYIKEELYRAFSPKLILICCFIAIFVVFAGFFEYISWLQYGNISLMYLFLSGYSNNSFLIIIFPILVSIPFATSYLKDLKTGTLKYIYLRIVEVNMFLLRLL